MNPNDSFYQYYEIVGGNDEEAPAFSDSLQVGASTLIFKVMEELKISELLESIHGETDANHNCKKQQRCVYQKIWIDPKTEEYSETIWDN